MIRSLRTHRFEIIGYFSIMVFMALFQPLIPTGLAQAYPPGKWAIKINHLGNLTVSGNVMVFLWNTTTTLGKPVLISRAAVGSDGVAIFAGLPWGWNCSTVPGEAISYSITANYTTQEGEVTYILLLPPYEVLHRPYGPYKMVSLAYMLNDVSQVKSDFTWDPEETIISSAGGPENTQNTPSPVVNIQSESQFEFPRDPRPEFNAERDHPRTGLSSLPARSYQYSPSSNLKQLM